MARTSVDIDASVLRELKKRQQRERKTLGQLISELLAKAIEAENDHSAGTPFRWVAKDLQPRVDLEDKDASGRLSTSDEPHGRHEHWCTPHIPRARSTSSR